MLRYLIRKQPARSPAESETPQPIQVDDEERPRTSMETEGAIKEALKSNADTKKQILMLCSGDVVLVSAKFHDGWYKGIRLRGYKVGYFPGEYVKEDALVESNGTIDIPKEQIIEAFSTNGSHHSTSTPENGQEPKELDSDSKRTKAAEEILSTEVSYCNGLNLIVEHFIQPLRIYGVLSVDEIDLIFSNVESLAGISKELVSKLENRLNEWDVKKTEIGNVLLEMFSYLKMFKPYFDSRSAANRLRIQYEKCNDRFKTFLSRVNCGHTLDSLLLMPIQRIPRYELLLKELVKRTYSDHPDFDNLSEALAKARETASELNEHIRQIENEAKIFEIIKMFPNDELDLIISDTSHSSPSPRLKRFRNSPSMPRKSKPTLEVQQVRRSRSLTDLEKTNIDSGLQHSPSDPSINHVNQNTSDPKSHIFRTRMFIHEGPVQKVIFKNNRMTGLDSLGEQSDRYLILFSDIALVAVIFISTATEGLLFEKINSLLCEITEYFTEAGNLITSNKLKLKERIDLTQCWIADKAESFLKKKVPPETFVLGTPKRAYVFVAPTAKDCSTWQKLLWKRISVEKQRFFQFWRNRQVPDQIFIKTMVNSKVQYLSMNDCELDIEFNEEISVIGFRKGGLWTAGFYDADESSNSFITDWVPAVNSMGKFGWIPAECVSGINTTDSKDKCIDQFSFVSVATALHIKRKMLELTRSQTPLKFLTSVKVYRVDGTFRTCKLNEATTTEDIINHLDKHNRLCGLNIEKEWIELWEESKDGSVKRKHKPNDKILETISFWGEYQSQLSLVAHTRGMKECVESLIDPAIEVTIERRQSRASSERLRRLTGEEPQQSVSKSTSLPVIADGNMNVKL